MNEGLTGHQHSKCGMLAHQGFETDDTKRQTQVRFGWFNLVLSWLSQSTVSYTNHDHRPVQLEIHKIWDRVRRLSSSRLPVWIFTQTVNLIHCPQWFIFLNNVLISSSDPWCHHELQRRGNIQLSGETQHQADNGRERDARKGSFQGKFECFPGQRVKNVKNVCKRISKLWTFMTILFGTTIWNKYKHTY